MKSNMNLHSGEANDPEFGSNYVRMMMFDRLPKVVRDALNNGVARYSVLKAVNYLERHGLDPEQVAAMIRLSDVTMRKNAEQRIGG